MKVNAIVSKANKFFSKNKSSSTKELVSESLIAFAIRAFSALATFFMNIVIGRYLGADESGYFFLTLSLITILATFCRMGSDNIMLRFVSIHKAKGEWNEVQSVIKVLSKRVLILSLIVVPVIVFGSKFIADYFFKKPPLETTLFWMGLAIPSFAGYMLLSYAFQGIKKVSHSVALQGVLLPFLLMLAILLFSPVYSSQLSMIYLIISIITFLSGYICWKKITQGHAAPYRDEKRLIEESKPLWTVAILQQCIQWGGQFVAGIYVLPASLAQLAVAQRTALLISFVLIAVNLVSAPRFASYYNAKEMEKLKRYVQKTTRFLVLVSLPLVIIVFVFAPEIMALFGNDFKSGATLLRILACGQFVSMASGSVGYLLMMSGHQKDMRNMTIINGISALILYIILTPRYGAIGTATATALAIASQNLMAVRLVKKRLGINTLAIW